MSDYATDMLNVAARQEWERTTELLRPSMMLRPRLSVDGNRWLALYGENIQDGIAGFGVSPADAFKDFDRAWETTLLAKEADVDCEVCGWKRAGHPEDQHKPWCPGASTG